MPKGYIYKITNKVNGKVYIGQTRTTLEKRFLGHCRDCNKHQHKFARALRKYGCDQFKIEPIEVIESTSKEDLSIILNTKETEYISKLNTMKNGYNSTTGGGVWALSSEAKENHRKAINRFAKEVNVFDKNNIFIKTYPSIMETARSMKLRSDLIGRCCRGSMYTYKGFRFSFGKQPKEYFLMLKKNKKPEYLAKKSQNKKDGTKVKQYDLDGVYIETFPTLLKAAESNNVLYQGISMCCRGKANTYRGYKWRYEEAK